jgi:hypothetical protein
MTMSIAIIFRRAGQGPSAVWAALNSRSLAGREERRPFEDPIFHVDEFVFFKRHMLRCTGRPSMHVPTVRSTHHGSHCLDAIHPL